MKLLDGFDKFLDGRKEQCYALLRIVTGYLFLWHGTQKLLDFPNPYPRGELSTQAMLTGSIELIGGTLVLVGLFTRPAAFICSGLMAFAYWLAHAPQANPVFPILNRGDLAVLFTFAFLYIACRGSGIWSIDSARS
jgi:putative oxidoreductase